MDLPLAIIYGGSGQLGSKCVSYFKEKNWWICSIDLAINNEADVNILVASGDTLPGQEEQVLNTVSVILNGAKLEAIICVAGGWVGGNALNDFAKNSDLMWRQSVWPSVISGSIAVKHLKEGGLLSLTGANAALQATSGMIGYGMAKAAVHQLTKSLAGKNSGLPSNSVCVAILPVTLDTTTNRQAIPNIDSTICTPLEFIANLMWKWSVGQDRPFNGSFIQLVTKDSETVASFI